MADYNIIADDSAAQFALLSGDTFHLAEGVTASNASGQPIINHSGGGAPTVITIDGTVVKIDSANYAVYTSGTNFDLTIGETGQILAQNAFYAITSTGTYDIVNDGTISAWGAGILLDNFENSGVPAINITNTGSITSDVTSSAAITLRSFVPGAGRNLNVTNSGTISGDYAIHVHNILLGGESWLTLTNSGTIHGSINSGDLTGNDLIVNEAGGVIDEFSLGEFSLGGGNDRVVNRGTIDGWLFLGAGDDIYRGVGTGSITGVEGGFGDDKLYGSDAVDVFAGGDGNDTLMGFGGDDLFFADPGADLIVGGAGFDTIDLSTATLGQALDLLNSSNNIGLTEGDTIRGVEAINGSAFDDTLSGENGANLIEGGEGNDVLWGNGGADTLRGGEGHDVLVGGVGHDLLQGGNGNDLLLGERGADTLQGGAGDDTLDGGSLRDNDLLVGGAGADTFIMYRAGGKDIVHDLAAEDTVQLNGFTGMTAAQVIAQYGSETATGAQLRFSAADIITFRGADLDLLDDVLILV